jgi:hypothetical protein
VILHRRRDTDGFAVIGIPRKAYNGPSMARFLPLAPQTLAAELIARGPGWRRRLHEAVALLPEPTRDLLSGLVDPPPAP